MRHLTRSEFVGVIALLAIVSAITGWSVFATAGRSAGPPLLREAPTPGTVELRQEPAPPATANAAAPTSVSSPAPAPSEVVVHVAGAVKRAGVYHLPAGARNEDALKAAGGASEAANTDAVNLAARVEDGSQLFIPTRSEHPEGGAVDAPGRDAGEASSPRQRASAGSKTPASRGRAAGTRSESSAPDKLTDPSQGTININTASLEQLQRIPGIGPAMAERILAARQESHGFHSVDDLRSVRGIGEKKLARMVPFVRLR